MTPKEKARELRDKMFLKIPAAYNPTGLPHYPIAKEMALIAVDEILKSNRVCCEGSIPYKFWQEVKQEILLDDIFNEEKKKGVKELIDKHKQERSYSEEEVIAFGEFIFKHSLLTHTKGVKSLFEQFKKK